MSLSLFNDILDSSINLFQDSLDSWGSGSNLSLNLIEDVLQVLSSFHDVHDGKVFLGFQLVGKISKVLANGRDEVLNGMLKSGFEDIIKEIIKDVVAGNIVFELCNLGHDGLEKINQNTPASFDMLLGLFLDSFHSSINLFQDSLDGW